MGPLDPSNRVGSNVKFDEELEHDVSGPYTWAMSNIVEDFQKKYTVKILQLVVSLEKWRAKEVMEEAYTKGVAKVISCPLEHAEFFKNSLLAKGLNSTIELQI